MDAQCFSFRTSWVKGSLALLLTLCLGLALTQPALALPTWHIQTVDSAGIAGWHTSLVLDSSGNPVISYYDRTNLDLKLVHCSNATCSGVNSFQTVDSAGDVGQYTSLALDSSGNPVISYYDVTNGDLKLVHCGNATCSGVNTPQTVDSAGSVGVFNSLALDSSGNPVISYYDSTNFSLKLVHCSNATCSGVNSPQTLDSVGGVLWYSSLVLDSSGNPVISYYDLNNGDLKLVHCGNATCSGVNTPQTVDSAGNVGRYSSLALDSSGNPVISYLDFTNGDLKLVHCGNTTCSGVNSFQTVDSAGNVGYYTSLALDSSGNPVISYYDLGNGDLKLVHCGNTTCSSAAPQIVDSAGDVGVDTSLALDSSGSPVISYFDQSNQDLKLARLLDDTTPPTANPVQAPAANASGWTISENVTVNWNWTDSGSGLDVANCQTSSNSGTDLGSITIEAGCSDLDDNSAIASYMLKIDPFAPLIARTRSPGPNTQGWNNSAVTVSFGCNDNLSGVASNTLAGATLSSEGANQSVTNTGSCVDVAGNVATPATVSPINIDLTKPTISAAATTAPNANGWYNHNVTIRYTCADALSGVAACPSDQGLSSEGTAVASLALFSRDAADNVSDPSNVVTVNIDKTAPSVLVTGVTNGAVYDFGSVPTAACSTSDALSGVATQATLSLTGGNGDGTGSFIATCSGATDLAGNSVAPVSVNYTVNPPADSTAPVITPNVVGTLGNNGWYTSDVVLSWTVVDAESAISNQDGCEAQNVTSDTAGVTFTCTATSTGGTASQSVTIKRDATAPTISAVATSSPNANGWYNNNVTVQFTCADALSGIATCPADQSLSSEGAAVTSTAQMVTDQAGNSSAASNVVTVQLDKTTPVVGVTGVSNGASYTLGSVPAAGCSTSDALSGVATQATLSLTGGNGDGTGSFIATCSGATDDAGNSGSASVSYTVTTVVSDACTTTALRDNFNRANGSLGSNWVGLTGQSFYKIAGNKVDVQLGGPVVWKPTTFGVNQAAFVTLSTLDAASPSQGVLLKVQGGTIPNGGAIAVVYDSLAKAVRVSTLRLNTPTWTSYGNTPATFANGDKLLGCVQANGTVRVYRNNSLLTTVTLNAADQSFFNTKGGKIGLWTVAAPNLFVDDFGGGALTGVVSATLDATVPAELADDGTAITVAVDFPTDDTATAPDAEALVNRAFLPLVNR